MFIAQLWYYNDKMLGEQDQDAEQARDGSGDTKVDDADHLWIERQLLLSKEQLPSWPIFGWQWHMHKQLSRQYMDILV